MRMIATSRHIPAPPEVVFGFLADLANHWSLIDRWTEIVALEPHGRAATVRLRGPFGVRRVARTRVLDAVSSRLLVGDARIGRTTVGRVRWVFTADDDGGTLVELSADVAAAGRLDRALLALGARRWLRRRFADALVRLAAEMAAAPRVTMSAWCPPPSPAPSP